MSASNKGFFTREDYQIEPGPIKRVYNLSYYGFDGIFNLHEMNPNTLTNIQASASATTYTYAQTSSVPVRINNPSVLSNKDSLILAGPTAKANLDVKFEITPDMDALIHEVNLFVPFALNIDTYDTGSPVLSSVSLTTSYESTGELIPKLCNTWTTGLSALSAPGTQVFIVNVTLNPFIVLQKGQSIICEFKTVANFGTGNTTGHAGLLQDVCYGKQLSTPQPIYYYPASMFVHIHPTTSHVNPQYITGDITP